LVFCPIIRGSIHSYIELYDLSQDLGESADIAELHPDLVAEFAQLMEDARTESDYFKFEVSRRVQSGILKFKHNSFFFSKVYQTILPNYYCPSQLCWELQNLGLFKPLEILKRHPDDFSVTAGIKGDLLIFG
jgi:hypothetical protein